jgi:signal transduction histidine kinase
MKVSDICPAEDPPRPKPLSSPHATGRSSVAKHRRKDGVILEVQTAWHTWQFGGRPARIVLANDVSERRRLEAQLRQAQKMEAIGQLAGGIAHDFNNLLTVINGFSEILVASLAEADPLREHAQLILQSGAQAADLTKQLLAFSRKQMLQPQLLNLNELLSRLDRLLRAMVGGDVEISPELAPDLHLVKVDPNQFEQVIVNLAVNARDAMPEGGRIVIRTENVELSGGFLREHPEVISGDYVLLTVRDTGHGMDAATKAHLFEPFFTTKGLGKGTGLGLATIYGIIKQSNGYIYVESEPGKGAEFRIYLPADLQGRAVPIPSRHPHRQSGGTETVLVVDDEQRVRSMVCQALRSHGYTVWEAGHGEEALALWREQRPPIDLLITDMVMPRMSGRQLAERLVQDRPDLKVLFISGHTTDLSAIYRSNEDGGAFLPKPFTPTTLVAKVRQVLDG